MRRRSGSAGSCEAGVDDGLTAGRSPWAAGRWVWPRLPSRWLLLLAVLLQVALAALPLPRSYDRVTFEAAGYLVAAGHSPYLQQDLSAVFHTAAFRHFATIGYPPPWPLLLGGVYRVAHALVPDLRFYSFATKLPAIAAAVALAYLTVAVLHNLGVAPRVTHRAWPALLFNPFLVYVAAIRGQIDPIVALLALASLVLVVARRGDLSAVALALAVCFKPIALPLLLAVLLALAATSVPLALRYAAVFAAGVLAFYAAPFVLLGWDLSPLANANAQLALTGAMSPATLAGLWTREVALPGHWWLLGLLWLPALAIGALLARRGARGLPDLLALGLALSLVFFLVRPWLSETNLVLLVAPALILVTLGRLDRRLYAALWVLPLLMTMTYLWPVKLLWGVAPQLVTHATAWAEQSAGLLPGVRTVLILAWQLVGWWTVVVCLGRARRAAAVPEGGSPHATAHGRTAQ
jgi:hypothetical protein